MHPELGTEEGDQRVTTEMPRAGCGGEVVHERRGGPLYLRGEAIPLGGAQQNSTRRLLEQAHGVLFAELPAAGVDGGEELSHPGLPSPRVVVGEEGEAAQLIGEAGGKVGDGTPEVGVAIRVGKHVERIAQHSTRLLPLCRTVYWRKGEKALSPERRMSRTSTLGLPGAVADRASQA